MAAAGLFVTGTDTEVGKTTVTTGLMRGLASTGLRVAGMKPVASGAAVTAEGLRNADAVEIQRTANVDLPYELVNPYVFEPPVAPHIAAADAGITMDINIILAAFNELATQADVVVVEGVGGWQVPLGNGRSMPDVACTLNLPVVLVVGLKLGCLNHALLTAGAVTRSGQRLAGWVANETMPGMLRREENLAALTNDINASLLGIVPPLARVEPAIVAGFLDIPYLQNNVIQS